MASGVKVRPRLPSLSAVTDSLLSPTLNMQALCLRFSTSWNEPHFEKPLVTEAQAIQIYSRAYGEWHSPEDLAAAQNIQGYLRHFLTNSDGAFYVGQGGDVVSARDSIVQPRGLLSHLCKAYLRHPDQMEICPCSNSRRRTLTRAQ
jgi:hypothetical protein